MILGIPGATRTPDLRFTNDPGEDQNVLRENEFEQAEEVAYRPAYREMPPELAQVVALWQRLPAKSRII